MPASVALTSMLETLPRGRLPRVYQSFVLGVF